MVSEKQIITKTKMVNKNGLNFFSTFNNILNVKGISISLDENLHLKQYELNEKNGFQYLFLHEINEFIILPSSKLDSLISNLKNDIAKCRKESELIDLIIDKM